MKLVREEAETQALRDWFALAPDGWSCCGRLGVQAPRHSERASADTRNADMGPPAFGTERLTSKRAILQSPGSRTSIHPHYPRSAGRVRAQASRGRD